MLRFHFIYTLINIIAQIRKSSDCPVGQTWPYNCLPKLVQVKKKKKNTCLNRSKIGICWFVANQDMILDAGNLCKLTYDLNFPSHVILL